jgi:hypothetical protein
MDNGRSKKQALRQLTTQAAYVVAIAVSCCVQTAAGFDLDKVSGHTIVVEGSMPEQELKVDGHSFYKNAIILFDELIVIDNTPALLGTSSPGGNACDGSPFVLSFPPHSQPKLDGPLDSCAWFQHENSDSSVVFSTHPVPGKSTEHWNWTPTDGFAQLPDTPFAADPSLGWDNLRERTLGHPAEVFKNEDLSASVKALLGSRFDWFQALMTGVGSGEFIGDDYVGTSCRPHMCMDEAGLLFLSAHDRRVFVAWKPDGQKIVVMPPVKEWPDKAKGELRSWAAKWK